MHAHFEAILFLGAAISITAFPMLARIIYERGLTGTSLGTLALSAGAIDDAAAWCVLAIVLASFGAGAAAAVRAIAGGVTYAVIVLTVGARLLARLDAIVERQGKMSNALLGFAELVKRNVTATQVTSNPCCRRLGEPPMRWKDAQRKFRCLC